MEAKYKTMTRLCFICHFFDKTSRHYLTLGDINVAIRTFSWNFCCNKLQETKIAWLRFFFRGARVSLKLPLFVITKFISCQKKPIFSSLPTHYRGAWGTAPDRALTQQM
jgi:hypothetical protein